MLARDSEIVPSDEHEPVYEDEHTGGRRCGGERHRHSERGGRNTSGVEKDGRPGDNRGKARRLPTPSEDEETEDDEDEYSEDSEDDVCEKE